MSALLQGRLLGWRVAGLALNREQRRTSSRRLPGVRLGPVGRCPYIPILAIFIFDNSASVYGVGGNDPLGNRFNEVGLAVETVSEHCRCGEELITLLNFDSPTSVDVAPTNLRGGMAIIERGLRIAPDGAGSSVLGHSLRLARQLAAQHPRHHAVLCVASDFELYDHDVAAVLDELAGFSGQVHALVLGARPPQQLLDDPSVIVTPITHHDPPGTLARAVFTALVATRRLKARTVGSTP